MPWSRCTCEFPLLREFAAFSSRLWLMKVDDDPCSVRHAPAHLHGPVLELVLPQLLEKSGHGAGVTADGDQPDDVARGPRAGAVPHALVEILRQRLVDERRHARP